MSAPSAPAGWYDDPNVSDQQRYWDGTSWTDHTAPGSAPPPGGSTPTRDRGHEPAWRLARTGLTLVLVAILIMVSAGLVGNGAGEDLIDDAIPFAQIPFILGILVLIWAGITRLTESGSRSSRDR